MAKIYTSYFANLDNLIAAGIFPVAICNKVPAFFENPNIASVAPTDSILWQYKKSNKTDEDREVYTNRYLNEVLFIYQKNPQVLIDRLFEISNNADIALCCYERPEDFCHRHILADFLNNLISDLNIEEYPIFKHKSTTKKLSDDSNLNESPLF